MESLTTISKSRDILCSTSLACLVFYFPGIAIVAAASTGFPVGWRTAVWAVSLSIMGIGCVVNALRCGRMHCYITGPFFLLMALITVLYGLGIAPLGRRGWSLLGLTLLIGTLALYFLPELLWGKYRRATAGDGHSC